jgi:protein gp37
MLRRMRRDPHLVVCHVDKLNEPFGWRGRQRVFVAPMGDLFHKDVARSFIDRVFATMALTPQHIYLVLTKRPDLMAAYLKDEWSGLRRGTKRRKGDLIVYADGHQWMYGVKGRLFPLIASSPEGKLWREQHPTGDMVGEGGLTRWPLPNVWLGVTTENQAMADERLPILLDIPAALHFASYEPALEAVDFSLWLMPLPEWGPEPCQHCHGTGTVVTCMDDLCASSDHCMHGDGEEPCPECGGEGEVSGPGRPGLSWLICGGESGAGARPCDPAWLAGAVAQCRQAGCAVFVKQLGTAWAMVNLGRRTRAGDPSEWPPGDWPREIPGCQGR